MLVGMK